MIGDRVNATLSRRPGPYEIRATCATCGALDYVAELVQPFARPLRLCRTCRQKRTGVPDTRNMRTPLQATATIATAPALERPRVAGLLPPGPSVSE